MSCSQVSLVNDSPSYKIQAEHHATAVGQQQYGDALGSGYEYDRRCPWNNGLPNFPASMGSPANLNSSFDFGFPANDYTIHSSQEFALLNNGSVVPDSSICLSQQAVQSRWGNPAYNAERGNYALVGSTATVRDTWPSIESDDRPSNARIPLVRSVLISYSTPYWTFVVTSWYMRLRC